MVGHALRIYTLEYNMIKSSLKDATGVIVLVLAICVAILTPFLSKCNFNEFTE